MDEIRYPIGMQSFPKIRRQGYAYVDKTQYIYPLLRQGQYVFLSRPRRFGKSLFLSTLKSYFEGERELFKGLAADSMDLDWTPSPVLRFDFNAEDFTQEKGLEYLLDGYLRDYEKIYGKQEEDSSIPQRFKSLIKSAYDRTGRGVVILVDEYDKPLLTVEHDKVMLEKNQQMLKSFFGNLKSMDDYIRFAFITGVARFSKVSIFSDLNNLSDISMDNEYADICGWTEKELVGNFQSGIEKLAKEREENFDSTLTSLRNYYDGYLFAPKGSRIYNPFSVLCALNSREIEPYWFETGTPTFLARWVKDNGINPDDLNKVESSKDDLVSIGFDHLNPIPLMFQTGYLSIESYNKETQYFTLGFPNREVELGFYRFLLPLYAPSTRLAGGPFNFTRFRIDLVKGNINDFMNRLATLLKDLPGEDHQESTYRAVTYLLAVLSGTQVIAEHHGYKGRSDIEVATDKFIYIFEFKYNKSVAEAIAQILSRDYAGRFALDPRSVFIIGANYNEKKDDRGLEYEIRQINPPVRVSTTTMARRSS